MIPPLSLLLLLPEVLEAGLMYDGFNFVSCSCSMLLDGSTRCGSSWRCSPTHLKRGDPGVSLRVEDGDLVMGR